MNEVVNDDRPLILQQLDGHWQKLCAAVIYKLSRGSPVIITNRDLEELIEFMQTHQLLTWGHKDSIELRLVTPERAKALSEHVESLGGRTERAS